MTLLGEVISLTHCGCKKISACQENYGATGMYLLLDKFMLYGSQLCVHVSSIHAQILHCGRSKESLLL